MIQELFYEYYRCLTEVQFIYSSPSAKGGRKFDLRKWIAKNGFGPFQKSLDTDLYTIKRVEKWVLGTIA